MSSSLKNKILAITRSEREAGEFIQLVAEEGGTAIALPTIEVAPKGVEAAKEFLQKLESEKHDYCAFMSPQAVNILFEHIGKAAALALKSTTVIAIGPKTKESLVNQGVNVRLMPAKFSSAGLVELLSSLSPKKKKIIIPRSGAANELANKIATKTLEDLGMKVDEVLLYTVRTARVTFVWTEFSNLLLQKKVNAVIFTSASNVRSFFEIMDNLGAHNLELDSLTKIVSIGPFTSSELKRREIKFFEAAEHTILGALEVAKKSVV